MAKTNINVVGLLTPEQKTALVSLGEQIDAAEKRLNVLKELGLGVADLEDKLQWAKKRRDILLAKG